jgi:hypothetical protein
MNDATAQVFRLVLRGLPHDVTEEDITRAIQDHPGAKMFNGMVFISYLKQGKPENHYKGRPAIPSCCCVTVTGIPAVEFIAAVFDGKNCGTSECVTSVEYSFLQNFGFPNANCRSRSDAISPEDSITHDPDYQTFVGRLVESPAAKPFSVDEWLANQKRSDAERKKTSLVVALHDNWYNGKKFRWEIPSDGKRAAAKAKRGREAKKNKEQHLLTQQKQDAAKRDAEKRRKLEREARKRRKQKVVEEKKKEREAADAAAALGIAEVPTKKNTFTVTSVARSRPPLVGADDAAPPSRSRGHSDPSSPSIGLGPGSTSKIALLKKPPVPPAPL